MKRRRPARAHREAADATDEFPDRDALLGFVRESKNAVTLRDVQRAFGLRSASRRRVQDTLNQLAGEGAIERVRGQIYRARRRLPEVAVLEIARIDADGDVFGRVAERGDEGLEIPVVTGRHAPARGDRVLARLSLGEGGVPRAQILRPLERTQEFIVGVFEGERRGGGTIRPADRRLRDHPLVHAGDRGGAEHGELVRAELVRERPLGPPTARIVERLGSAYGPRAASLIVVHQHGIPVEFSKEARAEAERAKPVELGDDGPARRADLRPLPLVTIDGADARDFDDAVFAAPDDDPNNKGGWRITVAIADVAHYVRPGSALDRAARERGNSVYFPDRVVPMLPEELSNDLCSLRPHEDRACLAAHMRVDAAGEMFEHRFERGLMRSAARLTYEQAQHAQDGAAQGAVPDDVTGPLMERAIRPLYGAYAALAAARARRSVLELDLPERKIELDPEGRVVRIATPPRLDSHRLIEEFMILANVAAAEALEAKRQPCMYRIHEPVWSGNSASSSSRAAASGMNESTAR
jgi:ribonuclease R